VKRKEKLASGPGAPWPGNVCAPKSTAMHTLGHAITAAFSSYSHKPQDKQAASNYTFTRYVFEAEHYMHKTVPSHPFRPCCATHKLRMPL